MAITESTIKNLPFVAIQSSIINQPGMKYSAQASILAAVTAIVFAVLGVLGNSITIIAFAKSKKLQKQATTWFVISLCISDLLFCAFNLPITATRFMYQQWIFGEFLCQLFPFFFYGTVGVSLFNIMLIAINRYRYMLVSRNKFYETIFTFKKTMGMVVAVWIFCFSVLLPALLGVWGKMGLNKQTFSCTIIKKDARSPKKILFLYGIIVPFMMVCLCYMGIMKAVLSSKMNLRRFQATSTVPALKSQSVRFTKNNMNLTKNMILLIACFILCFFPLMIVNVWDEKITFPRVHMFASILAWASAVINPIIYVGSSKAYRRAFLELFGYRKPIPKIIVCFKNIGSLDKVKCSCMQ